jgi:hypothetical protein
MSVSGAPNARTKLLGRLVALLVHPKLGLMLALLSALLLSPTLLLGFHLDDYVHRYLFSGLPGSQALLHAYESPFGIANGDPATNHWQIEQGYAPWWTHPRLLISLFRPLSTLSHQLDAALWPNSALLQHVHSLLFYVALVLAVTRLYRGLMGTTTVAGLSALMYALDQAHGFAVGWIANRNALIAALLGVWALLCHHRARTAGARSLSVLAPLLLLCALLAGEGAIAIFGYLIGYALFVERGRPSSRVVSLLPHALVVVAWRIAYTSLGRGATFSGLYLDPVREPLRFAGAMLERVPLLLLGQLWWPPAEVHLFAPSAVAQAIFVFALIVVALLLVSALPLWLADREARFWGFGMLVALVPACTTYPSNRLLYFVGLGAMALLSRLWHGLLENAPWLLPSAWWRRAARGFTSFAVGFHLLAAPLLLPLSACGIGLTSGVEPSVRSALAQAAGRELVIVSSPDFFYVKLLPVLAALEGRTPPRRLRALSFGAVPLQVKRPDAHTLDLTFTGGLLGAPLMELYRARQLTLPPGSRVNLEGMRIEVRALTEDGRIVAARFRFDAPLDDPRYCFLFWDGRGYRRFGPPAVGQRAELPAARLRLGL